MFKFLSLHFKFFSNIRQLPKFYWQLKNYERLKFCLTTHKTLISLSNVFFRKFVYVRLWIFLSNQTSSQLNLKDPNLKGNNVYLSISSSLLISSILLSFYDCAGIPTLFLLEGKFRFHLKIIVMRNYLFIFVFYVFTSL